MTASEYDVVVIGGGIAGLTAAHHAALRGASVACVEGELYGGLVANVGEIDGYPSVEKASGTELADAMVRANAALGVDTLQAEARGVALDGDTKSVETDAGMLRASKLVIASGARLRKLGVPGEDGFAGRGVSQCAFCDAGLFKDKEVAVVGGGDAALQEALHLARFCARVTLVHRGNRLRARRHYVEQAADSPVFAFRWNTVVEEISGGNGVESVRLRNLQDDRVEDLACAGIFVFIGVAPHTDFLPDAIARDAQGAIIVDSSLQTSVAGVFAVGAARAGFGGQLVHAAADGASAGAMTIE